MARTLSNYGITVPDIGNAQPTAAGQISGAPGGTDLTTKFNDHNHSDANSGAAVKKIVPTADVDMQGFGFTNMEQVTFRDGTPAGWPNRSMGFDGVDLYVKDGSGNIIRFSQAGGLNTALTNGWYGDYGAGGGNVQGRYTSGSQRFQFFANQPLGLHGFTQSSGHRFVEGVNTAVDAIELRVQTGHEAAAAGDLTVLWPPYADILAMANRIMMLGNIDTWPAVVRIGGVNQTTVVNRARYTRIFDRVWVDFNLNWSGGPASGAALTIGGLPFVASATLGATGPVLQAHTGGTPLLTVPRALSASAIMELIDVNTGLNVTDNSLAAGNVAGTFCYFT